MTKDWTQFDRDMAFTLEMRDRILVPCFYKVYATDGRYVLLDKGRFAELLQKRLAVDTIVQSRHGAVVAIEEKIVRWKRIVYDAFALETDSCTVPGHESQGWMHYCLADYLLFCFQQEDLNTLICYLIDFPALQKWFWENDNYKRFGRFGPLDTVNRAIGRNVKIQAVLDAGILMRRLVLVDPAFELPDW